MHFEDTVVVLPGRKAMRNRKLGEGMGPNRQCQLCEEL